MLTPADLSPIPQAEAPRDCPLCPRLVRFRHELRSEHPDWWNAPVPAFGGSKRWIGCFGNGGQRLWLMPDAGLACVIFAGAYDQPDNWITPTRLWREIVLANFMRS